MGPANEQKMTATIGRDRDPDARGYFGEFGGRFVPETLVEPVEELERAYFAAREDPAFCAELDRLLKHYAGRPTPVYEAARLTKASKIPMALLPPPTHATIAPGSLPASSRICARASRPMTD